MGLALQILSYLTGIPLQVLVIAGMLRGPYRQFPLVFVYVIADFLATVVETRSALYNFAAKLPYFAGKLNGHFEKALVDYYWINEVILQVLVYATVISLVYYATATLRTRHTMRLAIVGFAVLFAVVTFFIHFKPETHNYGVWMTPWSSNLNFCSAILDLALWAILIGSRIKDHRLLMLSGALGIQFTGQAIGQSLRNLAQRDHSYSLLYSGNAAVVLTYIAFLYILWQTFRRTPDKLTRAAA
jgi:hypothetical protein